MDQNKKTGPEWAPLRKYVETFKIIVDIRDSSGKVIRTEAMDYGVSEDRLWLGKISFWAWSNGHEVVTRSD